MKHRLSDYQIAILKAFDKVRTMSIRDSRDRRSLEMRGLIEQRSVMLGTTMWAITERGREVMQEIEVKT